MNEGMIFDSPSKPVGSCRVKKVEGLANMTLKNDESMCEIVDK